MNLQVEPLVDGEQRLGQADPDCRLAWLMAKVGLLAADIGRGEDPYHALVRLDAATRAWLYDLVELREGER